MPCPFFEPVEAVARPEYPGARLPLFEEYDGRCHATGTPAAAPTELRFRHCNHGYSNGCCPYFPANEGRSAIRFDILGQSAEMLSLLYIEEHEHAPLRWQNIRYSIAAGTLDPVLPDACTQAQAQAFCVSFLRRFSA